MNHAKCYRAGLPGNFFGLCAENYIVISTSASPQIIVFSSPSKGLTVLISGVGCLHTCHTSLHLGTPGMAVETPVIVSGKRLCLSLTFQHLQERAKKKETLPLYRPGSLHLCSTKIDAILRSETALGSRASVPLAFVEVATAT